MVGTHKQVSALADKLKVVAVAAEQNGDAVRLTISGRAMQMRGHNKGPGDDISPAAAGQLKAFIERIERLEEDKRAIGGDIKEVYSEAKGSGFDGKIIRRIVGLRRQEPQKRIEEEALLDTYLRALGME